MNISSWCKGLRRQGATELGDSPEHGSRALWRGAHEEKSTDGPGTRRPDWQLVLAFLVKSFARTHIPRVTLGGIRAHAQSCPGTPF